jgi:hypothetical protein
MTSARDPDKFAIVPLFSDSTGAEVKFPGAIMTGDMSAVMARVKDSRQMREDLRISNEADKVRRAQAALRADQAAFEEEQASFTAEVEAVKEVLLNEFVGKLDALAARMDAYEAELARDPDDDELPLPPDTVSPSAGDDGELQASHPPSRDPGEEDAEGDLPPDIERGTPPGLGTDPIYDPSHLSHPQRKQQPVAIGDEHSVAAED